ncbi:MAG: hypothetical protein JXB07_10625 [Anaerolineae bacterium]|nr:hypothetical protein [Anaerolineae bacterium]
MGDRLRRLGVQKVIVVDSRGVARLSYGLYRGTVSRSKLIEGLGDDPPGGEIDQSRQGRRLGGIHAPSSSRTARE